GSDTGAPERSAGHRRFRRPQAGLGGSACRSGRAVQTGSSVTARRVVEGVERLAVQIAREVGGELWGDTLEITGRRAGELRRDEDVLHLPERAIRGQRFRLEDIQARARQLSGL